MKNELINEYFDWMYQLVCGDAKRVSYRKLLCQLHDTTFDYTIAMDGNRAEDGVDLRYRFGYEHNLEGSAIASCLDNKECSVLEMMVALAIRCEEHIMDNPDIGNRTSQWFLNMIENLGLGRMTDERFDKRYVKKVLGRFLNREYERNGEGGLFTVHHDRIDMRSVEIWYQAMWYLDEVLKS